MYVCMYVFILLLLGKKNCELMPRVYILTGLDEIEAVVDVIDGVISVKLQSSVVRPKSVFECLMTGRYRVGTKQCTCSSHNRHITSAITINLHALCLSVCLYALSLFSPASSSACVPRIDIGNGPLKIR